MNSIKEEYNKLINSKEISFNQAQSDIVEKLEKLKDSLVKNSKKRFFKEKLSGFYIFGDVGRGKSFIMDLFFLKINVPKKRIHFHEFLADIHTELHNLRKKKPSLKDPLKIIAKKYAKNFSVLCFDEFQITDVADAMILQGIFSFLFHYKMVIITTSNRHPKDLYKGGIQREKYLEFVEYLSNKMSILELVGDRDYRQEKINNISNKYFHPINKENNKKIMELFNDLTGNSTIGKHFIKHLGRTIIVKETASNTAIIDFDEFFRKDYSAADYRMILSEFSTIFLINIAKFKPEEQNVIKRFINFIDIAYDKKVNCFFLAEIEAKNLYSKGKGSFEFCRTISRINEMSYALLS